MFSWTKLIPDLVTLINNMVTSTSRILFCILCLMIAEMYGSMKNRIDEVIMSSESRIQSVIIQLKKLKREHAFVNVCVDQLNNTFGLILLFEIFFIFVGINNATTKFLINYSSDGALIHWSHVLFELLLFFYHLINFMMICCFSDHMLNQVQNIKLKKESKMVMIVDCCLFFIKFIINFRLAL